MEPIARPYGTDIFGSQGLALCNIPDGKKGTGAFIVLKLLLRGEAEFRGTKGFSMIRIFFTISANSSGSMEKAPSGPPSLRRRVRCFSTILTPRAMEPAATGRPQGMIGKTHQTVEGIAQSGNHIQVDILIGSGIRRDTL